MTPTESIETTQVSSPVRKNRKRGKYMLSNCSTYVEGPKTIPRSNRVKLLLGRVTTLLLMINFSAIALWAKPEHEATTKQLTVKSDGQTLTSVAGAAGLSAMAPITGCGGGPSAKTYNMTVTATSGSLSKSPNVVLLVKQGVS